MNVNQVTPIVTTQPGGVGAQGQLVPGLEAMYGMGVPVAGQEPPAVWMPKPTGGIGCPAGLEYLTQVDRIVIKQQSNLLEMMTRMERPNEYNILNPLGQQIFKASEESDSCHRTCCRANRGFVMHVTDNLNNVIQIYFCHYFKKLSGWTVSSGASVILVSRALTAAHIALMLKPLLAPQSGISNRISCCAPQFGVFDADDKEVLVITGPACICPACIPDVEFMIHSGDSEIGKIQKLAPQDMVEMFSTADTFTVSFPMSLDAKMKALLFGATFLVDFLFFELPPTRRGGGGGRRRRRRR